MSQAEIRRETSGDLVQRRVFPYSHIASYFFSGKDNSFKFQNIFIRLDNLLSTTVVGAYFSGVFLIY